MVRELQGEGSGAGIGVSCGREGPLCHPAGIVPDPIQAGRGFFNRKTQQPRPSTAPCEPGEQSQELQDICGVQEGFGEAQGSAGSVKHRGGDEQLSWHCRVGVSLVFNAALSVTV